MLKITNRPIINFFWKSSLIIYLLILFILINLYLLFPDQWLLIITIGMAILLIVLVIVLRLKFFDFEIVEQIILVRNYTILNLVFKDRYEKKIELPQNKILNLELKKILMTQYLIVKFEKWNGKKVILFFTITYLSKNECLRLKMFLDERRFLMKKISS